MIYTTEKQFKGFAKAFQDHFGFEYNEQEFEIKHNQLIYNATHRDKANYKAKVELRFDLATHLISWYLDLDEDKYSIDYEDATYDIHHVLSDYFTEMEVS